MFGIAGPGKNEVDHVGGIAKISVYQEIAAVTFFSDFNEKVDFLGEVPGQYPSTVRLRTFKSIEGSSKPQITSFNPNSKIIKALSKQLPCNLFGSYEMVVQDCNQVLQRSGIRSKCSTQG